MKTGTLTTRDFDKIMSMVKASRYSFYEVEVDGSLTPLRYDVQSIGIDWIQSLLTWSWVYYYKFRA